MKPGLFQALVGQIGKNYRAIVHLMIKAHNLAKC
jgi:hypothetical protein